MYGIGQQFLDALQNKGNTMMVTPEGSPVIQALNEAGRTLQTNLITDPVNYGNKKWAEAPINNPIGGVGGQPVSSTPSDIAFENAGILARKKIAALPVQPPAIQPSISTSETPVEKHHPATGTKDLWDYAARLSPDKLKEFVDKNENNPNLAGVGYITTKDPDTGKTRIQPVISRPEQPVMNTEQATVAANIKAHEATLAHSNAALAETTAYHRGIESRAATYETNVREARIEQKKVEDLNKEINLLGKDVFGNINPTLGIVKKINSGASINSVPESMRPQFQQALEDRDSYYRTFLKDNKLAETPANRKMFSGLYEKYLSSGSQVLTK